MDIVKSWIDSINNLECFHRSVYLAEPESISLICILGAQTRWNTKNNPTTFDQWLSTDDHRHHIENVLESLRIFPNINLLRFFREKFSLDLSQYDLVLLILAAKYKYQMYRNSADTNRVMDRKLDAIARWVGCDICGKFIRTDEVVDHREFDCLSIIQCSKCMSHKVEHKNVKYPLCNNCLEDLEM
jgi:hypothetical protein